MKIPEKREIVDVSRLYASTDAVVWANEFAKAHGELWANGADDLEAVMIGWFANAIETAKNIERSRGPICYCK